jgi:hypothetical protein
MKKHMCLMIGFALMLLCWSQAAYANTELKYANPAIADNLEDMYGNMFVDWDNDGDLDMVSMHFYHDTFSVYFNTGTDANGYPYYEIQNNDLTFLKGMEDIDAIVKPDGTFDIIARKKNEIRIYRNSGTAGNPVFDTYSSIGTLQEPAEQGISYFSYGDLNGDGKKDAVVVTMFGGAAVPGEGENLIPPYHENMGLGLGYDNQGNWLGKETASNIYVYLNSGTNENPVFGNGNLLTVEGSTAITHYTTTSIAVADIDGDSKNDLIVAHDNDRVNFFKNAGNVGGIPYFNAGVNMVDPGHYNGHIEHAHRTVHLRVLDIDHDNRLEIMMSSTGSGRLIACELNTSNKIANEYSILSRNDRLATDSLPVPDFGDLNGDGKMDFISGDSSGYINFFKNIGTSANPGFDAKVLLEAGGQRIQHVAGPAGSIQGYKEGRWGYTQPMLFDWDQDGDLDILTSDISGYHTLYRNIGTPASYSFAAGIKLKLNGNDLRTHTRTKPAAINVGGVISYITLDEYGYLTRYEQNTASGINGLKNKTWLYYDDNAVMPIRMDGDAGNQGRIKLEPVDWDGDGDYDLLATGTGKYPLSWYQAGYNKNAHATLFVNTGTDASPKYSSTLKVLTYDGSLLHPTGNHTAAVTVGDINNDDVLDLIMAEEAGFFMLYSRSELSTVDLTPGPEQILFDNQLTVTWELIRGGNPSLFEQISGGISPSMYKVTQNLNLPTAGIRGATISWGSSDTTLIQNNGVVSTKKSGLVTLTATISYGGSTVQVSFSCYVSNGNEVLVADWRLDEAAAGTVIDSTGFAHGTNYGAGINQIGAVNSAYDFEESELDYVDYGSKIQMGTTNELTIASWIKPESLRDGTGFNSRNGIVGDSDGNVAFTLQDGGRLAFSWEYAQQAVSKTPIAYWPLDEAAGTTANDAIGSNLCTNNGATNNQSGRVGKAYDFEESEKDYLDCGSGLQLSGNTATFAAWVKPESFRSGSGANSRNVILTDTNGSIIFGLQDTGKLTLLLYTGTAYKTFQFGDILPIGSWSHVAAVMDGTNVYLYVNGILVKSGGWTANFTTLGNLSIGGARAVRNFDGLIDDVRVYNRGLSSAEIKNIVLNGNEGDSVSTIKVDAADAVPVGEWTHVAVTKYKGITKLYINGVAKKIITDDKESTFRKWGSLQLGRVNGNKARGFDGLIDETKIYNRALSDTEIAVMVNKGLLAHWKLDEASGTTVTDATYSFPGINSGAAVHAAGKVNTAYDFEESEDDYVSFGNGLQLSTGNTATIAAWIKPESFRSGSAASSRNGILGDSTADISFMIQDQGRLTFQWDRGSAAYETLQADASGALAAGEWAHVAVTRDGANVKLYINGIQVKSTSSGSTANFVTFGELILGRQGNNAARDFDGLIDDVKVYNRPLTNAEIVELAAGS